jgi:predicted RNA binding protein YcfA (HicA-like mRNA interferase family)
MPKLPRLSAREICSVLERLGFSVARQSGSHIIYKERTRETRHGAVSRSKDSSSQSFKEYLRDAGLSVQELSKLL